MDQLVVGLGRVDAAITTRLCNLDADSDFGFAAVGTYDGIQEKSEEITDV
jgi:hypothetical protein